MKKSSKRKIICMFEVLHEDIILPIFLRLIFFAWGLHFYDLSTQALCCGGERGLSPVHVQLKAVALNEKSKWKRFLAIKTIFWLNDDDWFIQLVPILGVGASIVGAIGYFSSAMFVLNFLIYHSVDVIFFDGLVFPWENLMFELGFVSIFAPTLVPWSLEAVEVGTWSSHVVWSYRWLLFRLMIGFGKTKFLDDKNTVDNSDYIYNFLYAQPMPNKLARFVTSTIPASWKWVWRGAALHMWFVEIPLPFLMLHSYTRDVAFYGTLSLQIGIFFTGCFGGFNLLTSIMCLSLLVQDDATSLVGAASAKLDWSSAFTWCIWGCWCLYNFVTVVNVCFFSSGTTHMWAYWADLIRTTESTPNMWWLKHLVNFLRPFNEFRIVHGYGVFPRNKLVLTRLKHVIETSWNNGVTWEKNEWKYLGVWRWTVAPFQPKMDYLMWYHGNGMNLEGFTVSFASPKPSMFSGCGMPSRIALRVAERSDVVLSQFGSLPRNGSSPMPDATRLRVVDQDDVDMFEPWSPEPWQNWSPAIEEYHWDAYLCRLRSDIFVQAVQRVEEWMLREKNVMDQIVVVREVMEYDGANVVYYTMNITGKDLMSFFPIDTRTTLSYNTNQLGSSKMNEKSIQERRAKRKDRFILTYLTWIIVHRVLQPWPKERSWFELSLVAHALILSGWQSCLTAIRLGALPSDIDMSPGDIFLSDEFVTQNVVLWQHYYPDQWKQTERTLEKLYRFDRWNTGVKLPIKGAGVLAYPHLFIKSWMKKDK